MKLARAVERRLERMLDGVAGKVFAGQLHPTEIAQRLVRDADLESTEGPGGTLVPNALTVTIHPDDLSMPPTTLVRILTEAYEAHAAEEGWRLAGPTSVDVKLDRSLPQGSMRSSLEIRKGSRHPWGRLSGQGSLDLTNNRLVVGRSAECDVVVPYEEISRRHALITRRHGSILVSDLDSANGTRIDGVPVGDDPVEIRPGSVLTLADRAFRLEIA